MTPAAKVVLVVVLLAAGIGLVVAGVVLELGVGAGLIVAGVVTLYAAFVLSTRVERPARPTE